MSERNATIAAILAPIAEPTAVAADERYLELRQEVGKLSAPAGGAVDWQRVLQHCAALLGAVGKDLLVAAYAALALFERHGAGALAEAIAALAQLIGHDPVGMTPSKVGPRAGAIEWLLERTKAALDARPATDAAALLALQSALIALQSACRDRLGDRSPGFRGLLSVLESLLLTLPAALPAATATSPQAPPQAPLPGESTPIAASPAQVPATSRATGLHERVSPWLSPISDAEPCGADPRGLPAFAELREEIARSTALDPGVTADWDKAWRLADGLLRGSAKDLQIAAWLALAADHRSPYTGLALGLTAFAELLHTFGEHLHPRRPKPRKDAAQWLVSKAHARLGEAPPGAMTLAQLDDLEAAAERLGLVTRERLGDDAPATRPLRERLSQLRADHQSPAPAEEPTTPPPPPAPPQQPTQPQPTGQPHPPQDPPPAAPLAVAAPVAAPADLNALDEFLTQTGKALSAAARSLREAQPADPRAYRLLRAGLWLHLRAAPSARPDGNTSLPGLRERDREQLGSLLAAGKWPALLSRAENLLSNHRLSLDLNRYSAAALTALGADYHPARLEVHAELAALLRRLPALLSLRDADGAPLADPTTQRWITKDVLPRSSAGPALSADDELPAAAELLERLRGDDRAAAFVEAQAAIDASASVRLRLRRQLQLAEACEEIGDAPLAAALFLAIAERARHIELDLWEPTLARRYLSGLARCRHRGGDPTGAREAIARLAQLDAHGAHTLLQELR
jgi:type VI secretion system protein VasJ